MAEVPTYYYIDSIVIKLTRSDLSSKEIMKNYLTKLINDNNISGSLNLLNAAEKLKNREHLLLNVGKYPLFIKATGSFKNGARHKGAWLISCGGLQRFNHNQKPGEVMKFLRVLYKNNDLQNLSLHEIHFACDYGIYMDQIKVIPNDTTHLKPFKNSIYINSSKKQKKSPAIVYDKSLKESIYLASTRFECRIFSPELQREKQSIFSDFIYNNKITTYKLASRIFKKQQMIQILHKKDGDILHSPSLLEIQNVIINFFENIFGQKSDLYQGNPHYAHMVNASRIFDDVLKLLKKKIQSTKLDITNLTFDEIWEHLKISNREIELITGHDRCLRGCPKVS